MNCNSKITYNVDCNTVIHEINFNENYVYIYVLQLNKADDLLTEVIIKEDIQDQVIFNIGKDGYYTLTTIKVSKDETEDYYYKNGKVYHNNNIIDLPLLLELNPEVSSGFSIEIEYYFQTCNLKKCYIDICQQIFNQVNPINCNKQSLDQTLIYKRDLLWSAINMIDFMVEKEQYEEAERLLERIMGCNGLCNCKPCNCGCSQ